MCGIASVINTQEEYKDIAKKIFKSVLMANESRGKDSTGVLAIDRDTNEFSLFKDTIPSSKLLNRKKFRQVEGDIWIGHTRLATTGEINIRNAHPLQRGNVFLVHNGVISNHIEIGKSLEFEHQVDSEILIPIVRDKDWDLLQDIKGSANFIAWNMEKKRIYVERHDNPLYFLTLKNMGIVVFSSVREVLEFIAGHYSNGDEVYEFENNSLVMLDMKGNLKGKQKKLKFPVELVESASVKYPLVDRTYRERYPQYYGYGDEYDDYMDYSAYARNRGDLKKMEDDLVCEGCGCELSMSEYEEGLQAWGIPLCYECLTELEEANDLIKEGKPLDLSSDKWNKFEDILIQYLP